MSNSSNKIKLIITILIFYACVSNAQDNSSFYYNVFDNIVGIENTDLYQGEIYIQKYRTINNKTPFYYSIDFLKGYVIYNGQPYHNLELKYDVFEDQVLLKLNSTKSVEKTIRLNWDYIDEFEVLGRKFVKLLPDSTTNLNYYGFYENLLQFSSFSMLKKNRKTRVKKYNQNSIYYEFVDSKSDYILYYKNNYHLVNSKNQFIEIFPQLKKEITLFYRTKKKLRLNNLDDFMIALIKKADNFIYNSTTTNTK